MLLIILNLECLHLLNQKFDFLFKAESVLSEEHRKEMMTVLMDSVTQLSNNLLLSKVEGEEATYINTTLFSSYGKRTTTSSMNRFTCASTGYDLELIFLAL